MVDLHDWDVTAANNNSAAPDGFPSSGATYGSLNNSIREIMAVLARAYSDMNCTVTAASADSNDYVITPNRTLTTMNADEDGIVQGWVTDVAGSSGGSYTVDLGAGALDLNRQDVTDSAIAGGETLKSGVPTFITYNHGAGDLQIISNYYPTVQAPNSTALAIAGAGAGQSIASTWVNNFVFFNPSSGYHSVVLGSTLSSMKVGDRITMFNLVGYGSSTFTNNHSSLDVHVRVDATYLPDSGPISSGGGVYTFNGASSGYYHFIRTTYGFLLTHD